MNSNEKGNSKTASETGGSTVDGQKPSTEAQAKTGGLSTLLAAIAQKVDTCRISKMSDEEAIKFLEKHLMQDPTNENSLTAFAFSTDLRLPPEDFTAAKEIIARQIHVEPYEVEIRSLASVRGLTGWRSEQRSGNSRANRTAKTPAMRA